MSTRFRKTPNLSPQSLDPRILVLLVLVVPSAFIHYGVAAAVAVVASLVLFVLPKYVYLNFSSQKIPMTVYASDFGLNHCCTKGTPQSIPWNAIVSVKMEREPSPILKVSYQPRCGKGSSSLRTTEWTMPHRKEDLDRLEAEIEKYLQAREHVVYDRAAGDE